MGIFVIRTNIVGNEGTGRFFYVESGRDTVAELALDLRAGPILCTKLRARMSPASGKMVVSERAEFIIGPSAVLSIEAATLPFVDEIAA